MNHYVVKNDPKRPAHALVLAHDLGLKTGQYYAYMKQASNPAAICAMVSKPIRSRNDDTTLPTDDDACNRQAGCDSCAG